jgi:hypothetical protein
MNAWSSRRGFRSGTWVLAVATCLAPASVGWAQDGESSCRADEPELDAHAHLRSLMLDLTGTIPSMDDYARLEGHEGVPESLIDELLASESFVERTVRRHRALLWNNVQNVGMTSFRTSLRRSRMPDGSFLYWRSAPAIAYRGDRVPCDDVPVEYDADGEIRHRVDANGNRREGYRMVKPYWAPATRIKVCAFDAQERAMSPSGNDCRTNEGLRDPGCGCGPNLSICRFGNDRDVTWAMSRDVDLRVAEVIREDRPYVELFTGRTGFVNGPLVQFLKERVQVPAGVGMTPLAYDRERLPDLAWTDASFERIQLPPEHAGVLTAPGFLLRFQTNRARAARFYDAFLCQPLSPPPGGLPANAFPHPDLQQRDGCKYCHALLEPAAAHWGRWGEQGAGFLDPQAYPAEREDCRLCGNSGQRCSRACRLHYITRTYSSLEDPYIGSLRAFGFLDAQHFDNVELGPKLLAERAVVDDRFPKCTARRAMEGLFGRELSADEARWLDALARRFVNSNYDYKELVKAIVTSPVYRRVR